MTVKIYRRGFVSPSWEMDGEEVTDYRVRESLPAAGLPLGSAASKRFFLTVRRREDMSPETLSGALVRVTDGETALGVWYVTGSVFPSGGVTAVISGADALSDAFEAAFTDAPSAYPRTLADLVSALCAAGMAPLRTQTFVNRNTVLRRMPEWKDLTLRRAFSHCAFAAGCLVRIGFDGYAELIPAGGGILNIEKTGVAVGRRSAGTRVRPLFEVGYKTVFYGDIEFIGSDTLWQDVTFLNGCSAYDAADPVRVRRKNGVCYLKGTFKLSSTLSNGGSRNIMRLPEGFRPASESVFWAGKLNGMMMVIGTDGTISLVNRSGTTVDAGLERVMNAVYLPD